MYIHSQDSDKREREGEGEVQKQDLESLGILGSVVKWFKILNPEMVRTNPKNYVIAAVTVKLSSLEIYIYLLVQHFYSTGGSINGQKEKNCNQGCIHNFQKELHW